MPKTKARSRPRKPPAPRRVVTVDSLNARQRLFVAYVLADPSFNATEAARKAGFAQPHSQGPRLAKHPAVRAAIDARLDQVGLTADEILANFSEMATCTIEDFLDEHGRLSLAAGRKRGRLHLVKKVRLGPAGQLLSLELYDRESANDKLARVRRMYGDERPAGRVDADVIADAAKIREARRARGLA